MNSIEKLIKQQPEDWSLKQEFYKQTDIYELEIKKIYMDSWLFIGHQSEIPNKGDYFVYNLLSECASHALTMPGHTTWMDH